MLLRRLLLLEVNDETVHPHKLAQVMRWQHVAAHGDGSVAVAQHHLPFVRGNAAVGGNSIAAVGACCKNRLLRPGRRSWDLRKQLGETEHPARAAAAMLPQVCVYALLQASNLFFGHARTDEEGGVSPAGCRNSETCLPIQV